MARVMCPQCRRVRVVPEGKVKMCRGCGYKPLTANMPEKAKVSPSVVEKPTPLESMTVVELREFASEKNIEVPQNVNKATIVETITAALDDMEPEDELNDMVKVMYPQSRRVKDIAKCKKAYMESERVGIMAEALYGLYKRQQKSKSLMVGGK